jgi:hypothetical protein
MNTNPTTTKSESDPLNLIKKILDHLDAVVSQANWSLQDDPEHPGLEENIYKHTEKKDATTQTESKKETNATRRQRNGRRMRPYHTKNEI